MKQTEMRFITFTGCDLSFHHFHFHWIFMDITTGEKRLGNPSNSHYHISKTCLPTSFNFCFLQIEEQIEEEYRNFIKASLS